MFYTVIDLIDITSKYHPPSTSSVIYLMEDISQCIWAQVPAKQAPGPATAQYNYCEDDCPST